MSIIYVKKIYIFISTREKKESETNIYSRASVTMSFNTIDKEYQLCKYGLGPPSYRKICKGSCILPISRFLLRFQKPEIFPRK